MKEKVYLLKVSDNESDIIQRIKETIQDLNLIDFIDRNDMVAIDAASIDLVEEKSGKKLYPHFTSSNTILTIIKKIQKKNKNFLN